jgi:hypothetical protein
MTDPKHAQPGAICLRPDELQELLQDAAEEGAKRTLARLGIDDDKAVADLREVRDVLAAYRSAKRVAWETLIRLGMTAMLALMMAGLALHLWEGRGGPPRGP